MKRSAIGYTDFSGGDLNFVIRGQRGDCEVSAGCQNCYAAEWGDRFKMLPERTTIYPDKLARLAKKRFPQDGNKRGPHSRPICFVCDMGDLFHEDVPDAFILEAFRVMRRSDVTWLVLTKRARRMWEFVSKYLDDPRGEFGRYSTGAYWPFPHVWLGVTAESQAMADERIPLLLETPAAVRWVSVEPCLSPVDLHAYLRHWCPTCHTYHSSMQCWRDEANPVSVVHNRLDLVICGAESGTSRRPFDVAWAVYLYEQCRAAGVAFFGKQDSALLPGDPLDLPEYGIVHQWPGQV